MTETEGETILRFHSLELSKALDNMDVEQAVRIANCIKTDNLLKFEHPRTLRYEKDLLDLAEWLVMWSESKIVCCGISPGRSLLVAANRHNSWAIFRIILPVACQQCKDITLQKDFDNCYIELLRAGANPNQRLPSGETLLQYNLDDKRDLGPDCVCPLIEFGARTDDFLIDGRTILFHIVRKNSNQSSTMWPEGCLFMILSLMLTGADPNEKNSEGISVLEYALNIESYDCAKYLLRCGADRSLLRPLNKFTVNYTTWVSDITGKRTSFENIVTFEEAERKRLIELCIGLRALNLPVLVVWTIYDSDAEFYRWNTPLHIAWEIAKYVKEFKSK